MINFWVHERGRFTIDWYLASRGAPLVPRMAVQPYERLARRGVLSGSALVLAALDQLTRQGRALMAEIWERVGDTAPTWTRLNAPGEVRLRAPFLHAMAAAGLNDFRAYPASDLSAAMRYPVFIRQADRHNGPLTHLLDSAAAVRTALRMLRRDGYRLRDLLLVEYLHTADTEGRIRKYAAYRMGSRLVRAHLMISHQWAVKANTHEVTLENAREEAEYRASDLHEAWLRQAFDLARIDYGRIDYGVADGRPQAWEINMNPTIGRAPTHLPEVVDPEIEAVREASRNATHLRLLEAFLALDLDRPPEVLELRLPPSLLAAARREWWIARQRERVIWRLERYGRMPGLGWPARVLYEKAIKRW